MQTLERVTSGGIFIMPVKYIPENMLLASGRFHCFSHNKHKWTERKNTIVREVRVSQKTEDRREQKIHTDFELTKP
jgi:hypothetical protein